MKLKTSKTAVKRIAKVTKTGIILRDRMSVQHLARRKSRRAKKMARKKMAVVKSDLDRIRRLVPYWRL